MNPLVSVVVTAYNHAAFIEQTLASVFAQTYQPVEVIVVDDGSTDETPARLAPFGERIVSVRQENQGVAGARNTGIRKARGELIAFLDGDDLWFPEKLALQVQAAQEYPGSGLIVVDGQEFDDSGTISESLFFQKWCRELPANSVTSGRFYREFLNAASFVITTSQVMVPARVFETVGLSDESFKGSSDYDLYLRIAAQFDVTLIKRPMTRWRFLSSSVSGPKSRRGFRYLPDEIAILKKRLRTGPVGDRKLVRRIIKERLFTGVQKIYYYGLGGDRTFASKALLNLWADNLASPYVMVYIAGLWCPDAVRNKFGKMVRALLCQNPRLSENL